MESFVLLACPGCTFSDPRFLLLSMFIGTVPITYLLLRPYARKIQIWGMPHIGFARLVSLGMMLALLVPLWLIGHQEYSTTYVTTCLGCLAACCVYLWFRSCWLLDSHHVRSFAKELIFPGLVAPAMLVLGTTAGAWVLGVLFIAPVWPMILVTHTISSVVIGVPAWVVVFAGLNFAFKKPSMILRSTFHEVASSAPTFVEEPR